MSPKEKEHWVDKVARETAKEGGAHLISSGITPSGPFHIGHLREVLTADAIFRALSDRNVECRFNYVADNLDPLRRVYPFLDAATFEPHVGKPLSRIPCPCGDHENYAQHFMLPFFESLDRLGVRVEIVRAAEEYERGAFNDVAITALERQADIAAILSEVTGKDVAANWSPFNTICADCDRITTTTVTGFDAKNVTVSYSCECGSSGTIPIAGNGKLTWRVDWPARWKVFGVTIEPLGKDHSSKGGSYDTGKRIAREVFGIDPPFPVPYEWIGLRGRGDMSSSKGNVVTIKEVLDVVPAEVLRYFVFKNNLTKSLTFDPGLPLLNLVDGYDAAIEKRGSRAAELARIRDTGPLGVPNRHIVSLIQTTSGDIDRMIEILKRNGVEVTDRSRLEQRVECTTRWLERFAPAEARVELQETLPEKVKELSDEQKRFLAILAERLQEGMNADEIHNLTYEIKDELNMLPNALFQAIYISLLAKDRGPRAGWFLSSLDMDFVKKRLLEASSA